MNDRNLSTTAPTRAPVTEHDGGSSFRGIKTLLKQMRYSQPFNLLATSTVRACLMALGLRSEKAIKHLHRVGMVRSRLPHGRTLRLWSRADDWVSNQVYWRGWAGYEPETVPLFFRLATRARVTLDIGAYVGFYSLLAGHANAQGKVYAFEPLQATYDRLKSNVALNDLSNVECIAAAVGDLDGTAEFFHSPSGMPCSSSLSYDFMRTLSALASTRVPVLRLDKFLAAKEVERVDLMKIDTETTEPQVLSGMGEVLQRDRPSIVCEVLKGRATGMALEELLRPLGYRFYLLAPHGPDPCDRIEGHPEWLNYLFTPLTVEELRCVSGKA